MVTLPDRSPTTADARSAGRFLLWLAGRQWRTLLIGAAFGVLWTLTQAAVPLVLGRTLDAGVLARNGDRLLTGAAVLVLLGIAQALAGVFRHRAASFNWLQACLRTQQALGRHVADHGPAVTTAMTAGEVVATSTSDPPRLGDLFDVTGRAVGNLVVYLAVAVLVFRTDPALGLAVLLGVPALTCLLTVVIRPLHARRLAHRDAEGRLTAIGADTVAGLRVLRGIGGEQQFLDRYAARSTAVRDAGIRVAGPEALLDAAHVLLPGVFVVTLTWLGARAGIAGRITPGELVSLYGYAAFLRMPLETATETLTRAVRGRVAARRVVAVLARQAEDAARQPEDAARPQPEETAGSQHDDVAHPWDAHPPRRAADRDRDTRTGPSRAPIPGQRPGPSTRAFPPSGATLHDPATGLTVHHGELVALVSPDPDDGVRLAERLARLAAAPHPSGEPRLGGVPLDELRADAVRARIGVNEAEPTLFSGPLRTLLDPSGELGDPALRSAIELADAADVLDELPDGLDAEVTERGRSFSGGQRQRLALARALLADPELLVLVEPTSAVDAHTEARIAARLGTARHGRTTLIATASPLVLDRMDRVVFLCSGRVGAQGSHRDLMRTNAGYRAVVVRDADDDGERDAQPRTDPRAQVDGRGGGEPT